MGLALDEVSLLLEERSRRIVSLISASTDAPAMESLRYLEEKRTDSFGDGEESKNHDGLFCLVGSICWA